ncbi:unnamed protein product, partial [Iphiclides podalirius]
MSNLSIMSVRELIDMAFGESDGNVINFKIIQTVLYLLARQLRVLGRNVEVDLDPALGVTSRTTINVTEIKMQAAVPKKKKKGKLAVTAQTGIKNETEQLLKEQRGQDERTTDKTLPLKTTARSNIGNKQLAKKNLIPGTSDTSYETDKKRANSREEAEKSPTPMASLESIGSADFPDNIQLMAELRKGASLTDSMAALQMSARLDAAEKMLKQMLSLVTDLARRTPGVDLSPKKEDQSENKTPETDKKAQMVTKKTQKSSAKQRTTTPKAISEETSSRALQELQTDILNEVTTITSANTESANNALKITKRLERKLEGTSHLESRMKDLEILVSDYADQINILDTGLSAQTYVVEELEQPCTPCNVGNTTTAQPLEADQAPESTEIIAMEMTDFIPKADANYCKCEDKDDSVPATPILPMDDD